MRALSWLNIKNVREFFWSSFLLASALFLAILSSIAHQNGQFYAAAFWAVLSLTFATVVCVTLIPKLLIRLKLDFLNHLQFFRFTRRGAFFILIILIIAFSTFNTGNNLLILILSFLLSSLVISGILSNLVLQGLKISLNIPDAIHAGQKAVFFLTLHNLKKVFPSFALKLRGRMDGFEHPSETDFSLQEKHFPYVRAGEKLKLNLCCEFRKRGVYPVEGFEVTTTFPFGFFGRGRTLEARGNIVVYPVLCDLQTLFLRYPYLQGTEERNRRGIGSTLYNIREYHAGDSARFVHWKSTAKLSRLMVKDFAREEDTPMHLIFSTYLPDKSDPARRQFEKAVSYIASLSHYYRNKGQKLHFHSGEYHLVMNGGQEDFENLMEYLARVQPSDRPLLKPRDLKAPCVVFTATEFPVDDGIRPVDYMQL